MFRSKLSRAAAAIASMLAAFLAAAVVPLGWLILLTSVVSIGVGVIVAVFYDWVLQADDDLAAERIRQNKSRGIIS